VSEHQTLRHDPKLRLDADIAVMVDSRASGQDYEWNFEAPKCGGPPIHIPNRVPWAIVVLTVTACGEEYPEWCDAPPDVETVVVDVTAGTPRAIVLTQLWESRPDQGQGLRGPRAIAIDPASGMLAVSDHVTNSIDFITHDGNAVMRWSRPGQGPGQTSLPYTFDWTPDGALAILDPLLHKVVQIGPDGRFVTEQSLAQELVGTLPDWSMELRGSDIIGVRSPRRSGGNSNHEFTMAVVRIRRFGVAIDTVLTSPVAAYHGGGSPAVILAGASAPSVVRLRDGLLAVAGDIPQFRIRILRPDGRVERMICQVTPAIPLSEAEVQFAAEFGTAEPAQYVARIGRLLSDGANRIWVQRDRGSSVLVQDRWFGPRGALFQLIDASGVYQGEVRAPADTRLAAVRGNLVIGLRYHPTGGASVVAFRLDEISRH